jgi:arginase family enzyme
MTEIAGRAVHLNLDGAWDSRDLEIPTVDLQSWGPRLRFSAPVREIERFAREHANQEVPFLVYGSGDFHHLTALWLRRLTGLTTVVSFDNHPDWDIRPPRWCCGGWVNRALELPQVEKVSVWGCGSFECWWPRRIFGNNLAEWRGRLEVHPWAGDRSAREKKRRGAILGHNWREKFAEFIETLTGAEIYITIDLDCLRVSDAVTNWESGRFTVDDVIWAIESLARSNRITAGDICGGWSPARYARWKQRFASEMDHPKLPPRNREIARQMNLATLRRLLPVLISQD